MPDNQDTGIHITPDTPISSALLSWEIYLRDQGKSPYTIKAFLGDMNLFIDYLPVDRSVGSITTQDINRFLEWLQSSRGVPCSPKSLARRVTSVKAFTRWLFQNGRISSNPAEKVVQQSVISPLPEVLTESEQKKVFTLVEGIRKAGKPDVRPYTLLMLLLETGIKKGECLAIDVNHIDLQPPKGPFLFVRYANPANRYKERKIVLSQPWVDAYLEYLEQYHPTEKAFPWSPRRLEYLLEDIGKDAGISKHLSFDMCRWTCALNEWKSKTPAEKIRQKLGISKIQWREIQMKLRHLSEIA